MPCQQCTTSKKNVGNELNLPDAETLNNKKRGSELANAGVNSVRAEGLL